MGGFLRQHMPVGGPVLLFRLPSLRDRKGSPRFRTLMRVSHRPWLPLIGALLHPATASHRDLAPARRKELGINDGLVRISVGIENVNDIIADIEQALEAVAEPGAIATGSNR